MVRFELPTALLVAISTVEARAKKTTSNEDGMMTELGDPFVPLLANRRSAREEDERKVRRLTYKEERIQAQKAKRNGSSSSGALKNAGSGPDDSGEELDVGVLSATVCDGDRPVIGADANFRQVVKGCLGSYPGDSYFNYSDDWFYYWLYDDDTGYGGWRKLEGDEVTATSDEPYDCSLISCWNTSLVTDMSYAFYRQKDFNDPIDAWDTSSVTTMEKMFFDAWNFNKPIGNWDTSSVQNMKQMFNDALDFNQEINDWDTSQVSNMYRMFRKAFRFNRDLFSWNTSKVTNMAEMFRFIDFNKPINDWDVSNVKKMTLMFRYGEFNQPLDQWDVGKVTDMTKMFHWNRDFNQPLDSWNVSKVKKFGMMFRDSDSFNQPLNSWDTSSATDMSRMFQNAGLFDQPLDTWDTSKVKKMNHMFRGAYRFNHPVESWDTWKVTSMRRMFQYASSFNQPLDRWDLYSCDNMRELFRGASSFNQCLSTWANKVPDWVATTNMFRSSGCPATAARADQGPWCQGADICTVPWGSCGNNDEAFRDYFGFFKECSKIPSTNGKDKFCTDSIWHSDIWSFNCPGLCDELGECPCSDFEDAFDLPGFANVTCELLDQQTGKLRERGCDRLGDTCRGVCSDECTA